MPNVSVYAESRPPMRNIDVWIIEEPGWAGGPRNILYFNSDHEEPGGMTVHSVPIEEGIGPARPSLTLDQRWVVPLVNALLDQAPVTADKTVLDMLSKESGRVDKLLGVVVDYLAADIAEPQQTRVQFMGTASPPGTLS